MDVNTVYIYICLGRSILWASHGCDRTYNGTDIEMIMTYFETVKCLQQPKHSIHFLMYYRCYLNICQFMDINFTKEYTTTSFNNKT